MLLFFGLDFLGVFVAVVFSGVVFLCRVAKTPTFVRVSLLVRKPEGMTTSFDYL